MSTTTSINKTPNLPQINSIYDSKLQDSNNQIIDFANYKNKVIIICNTALLCSFTPQFLQLQALYSKYHPKGLEIFAFPCNQFGNQEPIEHSKIIALQCQKQFGVTFHIMKKIKVNGEDEHELFNFLKFQKPGMFGFRGIRWNFEKFIINKNGEVVERFDSWIVPLQFESYIKRLLEEEIKEKEKLIEKEDEVKNKVEVTSTEKE
ncbi:hypothetical protein KGF54_004908 [Candida jiufengensis]|uniref:uncharacterized protein n=1 Tax=Candida jiufengensis TaxID=497108 RepID=UPI002225408B|nr:uncharacterized protein KGF54_004908 [Candida jiufengensis]KAI5951833.1 hypothetical protein KGF54_004908 [Candida jiufengensis]